MRVHQRFGTVIFDCDATLSEIEGIEELGREHRAEVQALTDAAMGGHIPLEQVYGKRLALARPTRRRVEEVGRQYVERLVPDALGVVRTLVGHAVDVRIVSSGVLPAVLILSRHLGLDDDRVAAVDLAFTADGAYADFDAASPLTMAGGKRRVVESWGPLLRRPVMLVGDGATDLEAKPAVDLFVAFAGVSARPRVMSAADVVIRHNSLAPVLALALDRSPEAEPARSLYKRGAAMLDLDAGD
ncbi:MAG TPA: HAD-IB family phosphatase [Longimicrobiales bacterium]|nr:HAD-IB family phosphatase [Longimicrobiales bacterium]